MVGARTIVMNAVFGAHTLVVRVATEKVSGFDVHAMAAVFQALRDGRIDLSGSLLQIGGTHGGQIQPYQRARFGDVGDFVGATGVFALPRGRSGFYPCLVSQAHGLPIVGTHHEDDGLGRILLHGGAQLHGPVVIGGHHQARAMPMGIDDMNILPGIFFVLKRQLAQREAYVAGHGIARNQDAANGWRSGIGGDGRGLVGFIRKQGWVLPQGLDGGHWGVFGGR